MSDHAERLHARSAVATPVPEAQRRGLPAPGLERVPGWDRWPWLRAGFSTREGGFSTVYSEDQSEGDRLGEQHLGWTPEDDVETVDAARRRFVSELASPITGESRRAEPTMELVTTRQIHGGSISIIEEGHGPLRVDSRKSALQGDGLLTALPGLLLGILTADCVPVLVADTRSHAVGAFHAGWRGTLAQIVERGVGSMRQHFGSRPEDLVAAIGPAIGPCCFAVGEEVRSGFGNQFGYAPSLLSEVRASDADHGKKSEAHTHLDLHEANRRQLLDAGLHPEAITVLGECTACTRLANGRRKYFSHRAEHGVTGRMLSAIGALA